MSRKSRSVESIEEEPSSSFDRNVSEDSVSTSSEKSRSKFSRLKKNLRKNLKMNSKEKSLENVSEIPPGKKKKSKKNKEKPKNQSEPADTDQEPSTAEKKSKGSVVRKLSLDKLYSNIKGGSKSKDDVGKGRRSTTPDISAVAMTLKDEIQRTESKLDSLNIPKPQSDPLEESELSEDYRTPACQSPVGSYIYDAASQSILDSNSKVSPDNLSENSSAIEKRAEFFSSSEPSIDSFLQSGTTTPRSDVDKKYTKGKRFSNEKSYTDTVIKSDGNSSSNEEKEPETEIKLEETIDQLKYQSDLLSQNTSPLMSATGSSTSSTCDANSRLDNLNDNNKNKKREQSLSSLLSNEGGLEEKTEDIENNKVDSTSEDLASIIFENDVTKSGVKKRDSFISTEIENQASSDKRECLFKILVIGELGTGKTSIIKRYVHEFFSQHYRATIGVDFALKVLNWDQDTVIRLQLWDIAGQERFGNMTRVYYKEAVGAFIVFDVTRAATFDAVLKWKQDLDSKLQLSNGSPIPCVLLANKCDQPKEGPINHPEKIEQFCKENNFSDWFETSAKENINIDQAAKSLVTKILQNDKLNQNGKDSARDNSKLTLDGKNKESSKEKSCAC